MNIWFDILTPKQFLFFSYMVNNLSNEHTVICTGRRYRELENLTKIHKTKLNVIGRHGGVEREEKLRSSVARIAQLQKFILKKNIDLTISFCSPEAARVSFGLGIKHIAFSDSPHIIHTMKLCIPLVQKLLIPAYIPRSAFTRYGIESQHIVTYKAIDAAVILLQHNTSNNPTLFTHSRHKTILFRMAEEQSAYIQTENNMRQILSALVSEISEANIVVLPRYTDQIKNLQKLFGNNVKILTKSYNSKDLLSSIDLFIGSGGTMTAESALMGIPTISTNTISNYIERLLVRQGILFRATTPDQAVNMTKKLLQRSHEPYMIKARKLVQEMEDPYPILKKTIEVLMKTK